MPLCQCTPSQSQHIVPNSSNLLPQSHLADLGQNTKEQHNFTLSSTMENEHAFIGLEWIEMIEKLVGEVARRSYKGGSRAQLALVIRDKGAMKTSFEKLCENLSFSLLPRVPLIPH